MLKLLLISHHDQHNLPKISNLLRVEIQNIKIVLLSLYIIHVYLLQFLQEHLILNMMVITKKCYMLYQSIK